MPQKKSSSAKAEPKKPDGARVQRFFRHFLSAESKKVWSGDLSEVELTQAHGKSHESNPALRRWFDKVYKLHQESFAPLAPTVELGSGGSQLKKTMPELITTDILPLPQLDAVVDALNMPYGDASVGNLTMINVLHHLTQPLKFFAEANRVLRPGGRLVFTEPYVSWFSYPIYRFVHHEPCDMRRHILTLNADARARLDSNQAMPTQLMGPYFDHLTRAAPALRRREIRYHSGLSYFLSGGVNYRPLAPLGVWIALEKLDSLICRIFGKWTASFFTVVFEKNTDTHLNTPTSTEADAGPSRVTQS